MNILLIDLAVGSGDDCAWFRVLWEIFDFWIGQMLANTNIWILLNLVLIINLAISTYIFKIWRLVAQHWKIFEFLIISWSTTRIAPFSIIDHSWCWILNKGLAVHGRVGRLMWCPIQGCLRVFRQRHVLLLIGQLRIWALIMIVLALDGNHVLLVLGWVHHHITLFHLLPIIIRYELGVENLLLRAVLIVRISRLWHLACLKHLVCLRLVDLAGYLIAEFLRLLLHQLLVILLLLKVPVFVHINLRFIFINLNQPKNSIYFL